MGRTMKQLQRLLIITGHQIGVGGYVCLYVAFIPGAPLPNRFAQFPEVVNGTKPKCRMIFAVGEYVTIIWGVRTNTRQYQQAIPGTEVGDLLGVTGDRSEQMDGRRRSVGDQRQFVECAMDV